NRQTANCCPGRVSNHVLQRTPPKHSCSSAERRRFRRYRQRVKDGVVVVPVEVDEDRYSKLALNDGVDDAREIGAAIGRLIDRQPMNKDGVVIVPVAIDRERYTKLVRGDYLDNGVVDAQEIARAVARMIDLTRV